MVKINLFKLKYLIIVIFIILLAILLFNYKNFTGNSVFNPSISGNVILEATTVYKSNSTLEGDFKIKIKQGELIPADSKVIVNLNDNDYEYVLSDLIPNDKTQGDFYVENVDISGSGDGYGSPGTISVDFVMKITKKSDQNTETSSGGGSGGGSINSNSENSNSNSETTQTNTEETTSETTTSEISNANTEETTTTESTSTNTVEAATNNVASENSDSNSEKQKELSKEENKPLEKVSKTSEEKSKSEEKQKESGKEEKSKSEEKSSDNAGSSSSSESSNTESSSSETSSSPITGNAIFRIFRLTGNAISETNNEISGSVTKNSPYTYELSGGETAEIVSSSQPVDLSIDGKIVTITTESGGEGFGKDYLGEDRYDFSVDLSKLDIKAEEGDLKISLVYDSQEITSISSSISVESSGETTTSTNTTSSNTTISNQTLTNETVLNQTITNQTTNITILKTNISDYALTDAELATLKLKTGSGIISITKSEIVNNRLIIRFQIGDYWLENSYDSSMNKEDFDYQINLDRVKWVKSLAQTLSQSEPESKNADSYLGEYNL